MKKIIACLMLVILMLSSVPFSALAEETPQASLMFASDFQQNGPVLPLTTLTDISQTIFDDGKNVDSFVLCGDVTNETGLSNYNGPENLTRMSASRSKKAIKSVFGEETEYHLLQGNHDPFYEDIMDSDGAHEYESYILYIMNTQSLNPWGQGAVGAEETVKASAAALGEYLSGMVDSGDTRPVIIATHVPLHFSGRTARLMSFIDNNLVIHGGTGDNMYSRYLFDVINKWGKYLNIVFLFGHNHDKGYDNYLGYGSVYLPVGSNILIPDFTDKTGYTNDYTVEKLNFTYMNAGYVGNVIGSEDDDNAALTCSLIEVYNDRLVITRYDTDGIHCLSGKGYFNNYPEYSDNSVFVTDNEDLLSVRVDSPASILRFPAHKHSYVKGICSECGIADPSYMEYIPGDVDSDGKVTAKDVNILKLIVLGKNDKNSAADIDSDGKVTVSDVQLLKIMVMR